MLVRPALVLMLLLFVGGTSGCAQPERRPTRVVVPRAEANTPAYAGTALAVGGSSVEELSRQYPRREPDAKLAAWVRNILSDSAGTQLSSAPPLQERFANGGVQVPLLLHVPPACADRLCPVVVHVSGGCARPGLHWRTEFFLRAGYVYVEPNIRGTPCSEAWASADDGPRRLEAYTDLEALARYLKQRLARDGQTPKVAIFGWSWGGNQTLVAMTRFGGAYDAGFALSAKTDFYSFFRNTSEELRNQRAAEYGHPDRDAALMQAISPVSYVERIQAPVALMLGARDPKVSLSDADTFVQKARALQKDVSLMIVPEHAHLTEQPEEIVFEHAHVLQFLSEALGVPLP